VDAAFPLIKEEYEPKAVPVFVTWDETVEQLKSALAQNNNKPKTVKDYLSTIKVLREVYPESQGPQAITPALAKLFKARYQTTVKSPYTVANRLNKLSVIWNKWLIESLGLLASNPWEEVPPPKLENLTPRLLKPEEIEDFLTWLDQRWEGWPLPRLFFTVKGLVGCRLGELCSLRSTHLLDGRLVFLADATKGRKERKALLPASVYQALQELAGPTYLWQQYTDIRQEILTRRGQAKASKVRPFDPTRLERWMQKQIQQYLAKHPAVETFSAHDFRRKAMTAAYRAGVPLDRASVAFGCNPNTMRTFYLTLDETAIADEVLRKIQEQ
jgi:integrase